MWYIPDRTLLCMLVVMFLGGAALADSELWSVELHDGTFPQNIYESYGVTFKVAATDEANLYVADINGTLYAIAKDTGMLVWHHNPCVMVNETLFQDVRLVNAGTGLVFFSGIHLYGISAATGATLWKRLPPVSYGQGVAIVSLHPHGLFAIHDRIEVFVYDAASGDPAWNVTRGAGAAVIDAEMQVSNKAVVFRIQTWDNVTSSEVYEAQILSAKTGDVKYTFKGAHTCAKFNDQSNYFACSVKASGNRSGQPQYTVEVVDLRTHQQAWRHLVGGIIDSGDHFIRMTPSALIVALVPDYFCDYKGFIVAFDLQNGGAPFWNNSLSCSFAGVISDSIYEYHGLYLVGIQRFVPGTHGRFDRTQFVAFDVAAGSVAWVLEPPSTSLGQLLFAHESIIVPNLMGWSRFAPPTSSSQPPQVHYRTLDKFDGITTAIAEENDYFIISGSEVSRYTF